MIELLGEIKAAVWWTTANPRLKNSVPHRLLSRAREKELFEFIENATLEELEPPTYVYKPKIPQTIRQQDILKWKPFKDGLRMPKYFEKPSTCLNCRQVYLALYRKLETRDQKVLYLCTPCGKESEGIFDNL